MAFPAADVRSFKYIAHAKRTIRPEAGRPVQVREHGRRGIHAMLEEQPWNG